jgi:hypothetical protein
MDNLTNLKNTVTPLRDFREPTHNPSDIYNSTEHVCAALAL